METVAAGIVQIEKEFAVRMFNEDDGWMTKVIKPGRYSYRVKSINGWKPRQMFVNNEWIDVGSECDELEEVISL